ncbi:nitroreductase/quinone reductase family protein [Kutzneria viridogrisea]|uniref:Hemerythrin HHE cation binding protein n=2 Tax=Kutzneria TaxID=43356 RepID=W5W9F3_9PSEU|nr:nitroreductase/quinone reductase family protein [Kutzneria albida]AHH97146.1 hemerythrin HHE cation binding protein [Kutzneria albida DSM 43870]MBA8931883.1 deazaflavin-dependent oxidoreductase (nitroreductase family) [Kutzneria viridogrisea]
MSEHFDFNQFQRNVIAEFRANRGEVGGMFAGARLALLTTTGARTGRRHTVPLGYLEVAGQPLVIASAGGAPGNPAWYHNILCDPKVVVETGTETYQAVAAVPEGAERDALFAAAVEQAPGYADYQARTTRVIPVVTLHRVKGLGDFLVEVHAWLRKELAELRAQAEPGLAAQLRAHCARFCGALTQHHTGEDRGAFPMLADRFPELAPVLDELGEQHVVVARLQERIQQLVDTESDPDRLRAELDRLSAELEAHFDHEERTVVAALNALGPAPELG